MDIEISTDKLSATKSRIMVPSYFITFSNMNCYCHLVSCLVFMWYSLIQYKGYNSKLKIFDGVQFRKYFISLPAFYLIIWLMKSPKNFEKTSILKIWQLVFFRCVKTHFGEIPLKSGMTKIDFHQYCPITFISLTKCSQYCL